MVCAFLAACGDPTPPPPVEEPIQLPLLNRIVFQSTRTDTLGDIRMVSTDGTGFRTLTDSTTRDGCPSLSPDGNWIAFHQLSRALATTQTYPLLQDSLVLMRADGGNRVRLAHLERYAVYGSFCPRWSGASDRLVTVSATEEPRVRSNQNYRARVLDRAGTVLSAYDFGNLGVTLRSISFSPDGTRFIASVANNSTSGPPSGFRVYSMRIDGTDRLVIGDGGDGVWSPDGNSVAWNCFGVCISNAAGGNVRVLYSESGTSFPSGNTIRFSNDGLHVAFGCTTSGGARRSLCIANVATGTIQEIAISADVGRISWLSDNTSVAFECTFVSRDICLAKRGSVGFANLTSHPAHDGEPSGR